jgi:hypothetical protein
MIRNRDSVKIPVMATDTAFYHKPIYKEKGVKGSLWRANARPSPFFNTA